MDSTHADPKARFSSRVEAYVAARPRYPAEIIPHLRDAIGLTPRWHVVDLGSGTGISCEMFLANGNRVTGIEPNAAMRQAAEQALGVNFTSVDGSAEATTLPDGCCDLVVAAQAFHWFDIPAARRETRRILRPGGWALLIWNDRKLDGTPFLEDYERMLVDFGTDYMRVRHNNVSKDDIARFFQARGLQSARFESTRFPNHQHLDHAGLRNRVLSSSYTPPPGHPKHEPMLARLDEIFARHRDASGQVTIAYETELYYGRPS